MQPAFQRCLNSLMGDSPLNQQDLEAAVKLMFNGSASPVEISALLTAMKLRGEHTQEMITIATLMLENMSPIPVTSHNLLDTCGTGGDNMHTFNISTAVAIVAAGAGVNVAKHGNRSVSSTSGSADVLETLGVNVQLTPPQVAQCIEQVGIGFCFAPLFHSAMKHLAAVRKELGFRTIFNLLGPLTNPARADFQLIGASRNDFAEKIARAKMHFLPERCVIVCGNDELDEVALWGKTSLYIVEHGNLSYQVLRPADLDLPEINPQDLVVKSPKESALVIQKILQGEDHPGRHIVLANTACGLYACKKVDDFKAGVELARTSIDSGKALQKLQALQSFKPAS